jgi:anaphase-promoting complex subunit 3
VLIGGIDSHSDTDRQALPDLASVECLLGHLYRLFGDTKEAADNYTAALSANPFLWEAFDGLCKLGAYILAEVI